MQIFFWRVWNGILFAAIVMTVPTAGQPVGAEVAAEQGTN